MGLWFKKNWPENGLIVQIVKKNCCFSANQIFILALLLTEKQQIRYLKSHFNSRKSNFIRPSDIYYQLQLYTAKSQYWLHKAGASPEHQVNNKENRIFIGCFCHNVGGQGQRTLQAPQMMQWAIRQREPPSFVARNPPAIPVTSTTNAAGWCIVPYVMSSLRVNYF